MKFLLKNQKNAMNAFVLYDTQRLPQKSFQKIEGDIVSFDSPLERGVFMTKLFVPGFGGATLFADNGGEGYPASSVPLDFYYEAARSRMLAVCKYSEKVEKDWGFLPKKAMDKMAKVAALLEGGPVSEEKSLEALKEVLWAGEEIVLFDSQNKIAKRGIRKDFLLGISTKGVTSTNETWRKYFSELFNYCCVPLHWGIVEPFPNEKHYEVIDEMVKWPHSQGMKVRGHALVWFCILWEHQNWMRKLSFPELKAKVLERVEFLMKEYKDYFSFVDFNEVMQNAGLSLTFDQHFEIVKEAYQIVRKYSPDCTVMLNFFDEWQEGYGIDPQRLRQEKIDKKLIPSDHDWDVRVYDYLRCV